MSNQSGFSPVKGSFLVLLATALCVIVFPSVSPGQNRRLRAAKVDRQTYDYFPKTESGDYKFPELKSECSHIKFIGPDGQKEKVDPDFRELLVPPRPYQRKLVILALNQLPKFICRSVAGIAFYDPKGTPLEDESPMVKLAYPDVINLNSALYRWRETTLMPVTETITPSSFTFNLEVTYKAWPTPMANVMHEAGHCAFYLLESQTKQPRQITDIPTPWPVSVQNEAKEIVKNAGIEESFWSEWERVHESFEDEGLAEGYSNDKRPSDRTLPPERGFLTNYAQRNSAEDIAETISVFTIEASNIKTGEYADELIYDGATGTVSREGEKSAPNLRTPFDQKLQYLADNKNLLSWVNPCGNMRDVSKVGVPKEWSAVYAKIMFLIDVKLIDQDLYDQCASSSGEPKLRPRYDRTDNGWHRVDFDTGNHLYTHNDIRPGFPVSKDETQYFKILGDGVLNSEGKSYKTHMNLTFLSVEKPAFPRGLYSFGLGPLPFCTKSYPGLASASGEYASFELEVPEARSKGYCAVSGYVWVTRATRNFVEAKMEITKVLKRVGLINLPEPTDFKVYIRWTRPGSQ